jgi:ribose transport system permease protein
MSALVARVAAAQRRLPVLQVVALLALFAYGIVAIQGFAAEQSVRSMLVLAALLGLAATGQTLVVIIGALDFSVPGMSVLGATVISELCGARGWSFAPALLVVVVLCGVAGGAVGWVCHRFRVSPIIATLGVSAIALGGVQVWTHSQLTGSAPTALSRFVAPNGTTAGLPVSPVVVLWAAFAVVLAVVLHRTRLGRWIYATGASPRAAELALVDTRRIWTGLFGASAVMSGVVGVLLAGFSGADPTLGDPYLFQGLTAVIVGGTAFRGARGDYTHTVLGALILTELATILVGLGYDLPTQQIVFGVLVLVVVAGYGRQPRLADRV